MSIATKSLKGYRVAVIATDGFEETELTVPYRAIRDTGATVHLISLKRGPIQAFKHHDKSILVEAEYDFKDARLQQYDAIVLPGGALNADTLRMSPEVQSFVRNHNDEGKPIAAICHAGWILISAGLITGRTLTSYEAIQDDIRNAGGHWVNQEVVVDKNWVTSRKPDDLPGFVRETIALFSEHYERLNLGNIESPIQKTG